jgi:hypothetical protein
MMTNRAPIATSRRRFLKTSGAMVAMIPVVNLMGCSDDASQAAPAPRETPEPAQPAQPQQPAAPAGTSAETSAQPAPGGNMPKVSEDEPTARALSYVHDANDVDASQQPRYADGQLCENCALYIDESSDEADWGGCSIFPGKLVNAKGWCNAYVPMS